MGDLHALHRGELRDIHALADEAIADGAAALVMVAVYPTGHRMTYVIRGVGELTLEAIALAHLALQHAAFEVLDYGGVEE